MLKCITKPMRGYFVVLLTMNLLFGNLFAQNTIGMPSIVNYIKKEYRGATQNWMITQLNNGVVLVANNDGLLSYDGVYWKKHTVSNRTIVRSVAVDAANRIFAGAQDELGYFLPDSNGNLYYQSLKSKIPEKHRNFTDVWQINFWGNHVFFRTEKSIYVYDSDTITVFDAPLQWTNMQLVNGKILAHQRGSHIYEYSKGSWKVLLELPVAFQQELVAGIVYHEKTKQYIIGFSKGIYVYDQGKLKPWYQPLEKTFEKANLIRFLQNRSGDWMIATQYQGMYVLGEQQDWVQHFSTNEGLQNNHVNYIFEDQQGNAWLALENGIDVMLNSNAIKKILPEGRYDAAGYAMLSYKNHLYLGTTNGLYQIPVSTPGDFTLQKMQVTDIPRAQGQVRNIQAGNFGMILSKHEGVQFYYPEEKKLVNSSETIGHWVFQPIVWDGKLAWIAGHYLGLSVWTETQKGFQKEFDIPDYYESSRFVEVDQQNRVWISHPYRGIYLLEQINEHTAPVLFGEADGLPSKMNNHVFKLGGRMVFCTIDGVYEFDDKSRRFFPSEFFKKYIGNIPIRYVKQDEEGSWWFITDKKLGVIDFTGTEPQYWEIAELEDRMVRGFDRIEAIDANNILIGAEEGFLHINFKKYKSKPLELKPIISSIQLNEDHTIYNGFGELPANACFDYLDNQLKFNYATPSFGSIENIKFSYRLKGYQDEWSEWSDKMEKEFMNLPAGQFVFEVKLRTNKGIESAITGFPFQIYPPWYLNGWAYLLYFVMIIGLISYLFYRQHQKYLQAMQLHQEEQSRLKYLHELELEKSEKELVELRNEKLQRELAEKNQELASNTLHLVHKEEVLAHLKENLQKVNGQKDVEYASNEIKRLLKKLGEEEKQRETWEQFAVHFDTVHANFIQQLIAQYPKLSSNEVKLCTYLRLNLSSKEIAKLMNISVRGVEISRYRLRKKLQLQKEENLFHFLYKVTNNTP